jgi:hypothetical protein
LVSSARRLTCGSQDRTANSRRPAVVLGAGEELGSRGEEKGELPDSGGELVYCKPELKEQGPKKKQASEKKGSRRLSKKRTTRALTQGSGRCAQEHRNWLRGTRLIIAPRSLELAGS